MQAKAHARFVRISPRKARLVIDLIRGKNVGEAFAILRHTPKAASPIVEKVLKSAVANAEHNYSMNPDRLFICEAYVNQGPTLKRIRPRARGRADRILKRTSHITVVVAEREERRVERQPKRAPQAEAQQTAAAAASSGQAPAEAKPEQQQAKEG